MKKITLIDKNNFRKHGLSYVNTVLENYVSIAGWFGNFYELKRLFSEYLNQPKEISSFIGNVILKNVKEHRSFRDLYNVFHDSHWLWLMENKKTLLEKSLKL